MLADQPLSQPVRHPPLRNADPLVRVRDLNLWYGDKHALVDVEFDLYPSEVLAFMGPSGCGKTSALKCLNRMHDETRDLRMTGSITMEGRDIHDPDIDPPLYRRRFGWVAQTPNPFPTTIHENVAYGPRIHGLFADEAALEAHVEDCLRRANLWHEVKDVLHAKSGVELPVGQQQRLCIARALSTRPEVLLMDEPTGSIDPIATRLVEDLLIDLKADHSIVMVTHSLSEAKRVADRVAYFHLGRLLEIGPAERVFSAPETAEARGFLAGRFG
jgi:phosphate transport system ATP-binding protein